MKTTLCSDKERLFCLTQLSHDAKHLPLATVANASLLATPRPWGSLSHPHASKILHKKSFDVTSDKSVVDRKKKELQKEGTKMM